MGSSLSRRGLLGTGALGLLSSALPVRAFGADSVSPKAKKPKNVIFLVADGMSMGVPSMLDHYLQLVEGRPSFWRTLMAHPETVHGFQDTRSLGSLVTDSAAASSSWGSGRHVWNGMLNAYPDGTRLRTLYDLLGEHKMRRGLVSTTSLTDATPAGFAVSVENRDDEELVALEYLKSGVEVIMGGGGAAFDPRRRKDGRDLFAEFAKRGYALPQDRKGMQSLRSGKALGMFGPGSLPYAVDRRHDPEFAAIPSLDEMTRTAIDLLKGGSEGFILQVEAARVDHAAHANDFAALLHDLEEFDRALEIAVEFARKDGETLVVATSDHGNSNPGLDGSGDRYVDSTAGLRLGASIPRSYESILHQFAGAMKDGKSYDAVKRDEKINPSVENVRGLVARDLGVELTKEEAQMVSDALVGASPLRTIEQYNIPGSALGIAVGNHTHVGWTGRQHTDDYTLVTAMGPGSEAFRGLNQNTTFFDKLLATREIAWSNPTTTAERARESMDRKKAKALSEAVKRHWAIGAFRDVV